MPGSTLCPMAGRPDEVGSHNDLTPDSGKWAVIVEGGEEEIVKGRVADYYEGEE